MIEIKRVWQNLAENCIVDVGNSILLPTIKYAVHWNKTSILPTLDCGFKSKCGIKMRYLHHLNVFELNTNLEWVFQS